MAVEDRVVGSVAANDGARMGRREAGAGLAAADLDDDHGNVARRRLLERCHEAHGLARGLDEQADCAGRTEVEREVEVVGGGGGEFLARRHQQVPVDAPADGVHRAVDRPRLADHGHPTGGALAVAAHADADLAVEVVEARRIAAADRQRGLARQPGEPLGQRRPAGLVEIATGEDGRGARPRCDGLGENHLEAIIGDADDRVVHRLGKRADRGMAGPPLDCVVVRVHQIDAPAEPGPSARADHAVAVAIGARRRADHGDRSRRQQGRQSVAERQDSALARRVAGRATIRQCSITSKQIKAICVHSPRRLTPHMRRPAHCCDQFGGLANVARFNSVELYSRTRGNGFRRRARDSPVVAAGKLARPRGFEPLTLRFVV